MSGLETFPPQPARAMTRGRVVRVVAVWSVALVVAHVLDGWGVRVLRFEGATSKDWGRALRVVGYVPLWVGVAVVLWWADGAWVRRGRAAWVIDRWSRGAIVLLGASLGGVLTEAGKLVLRRERPPAGLDAVWDGAYTWKALSEGALSSGGIGLPSSHAGVAFGGVIAAGMLWPRHRWWLWLVGAGCAFQRVSAGAHFASDVVLAALVGAAAGALVWRGHWWVLKRRLFGRGGSGVGRVSA